MFLTNGVLIALNDDGSDGATNATQPNQKTLSIGTAVNADVVLPLTTSPSAVPAIYCQIIGDAFGRVSVWHPTFAVRKQQPEVPSNVSALQINITNSGPEKVLLNGIAIKKQRPIFNGNLIEIGVHKFRWDCTPKEIDRPVTPADLLSNSVEAVKIIHKTVSYSEPSGNAKSNKIVQKIKTQATKKGRFTIFT